MTKKTMFEMVFPNANTGNGVTFTEEKLGGGIVMKYTKAETKIVADFEKLIKKKGWQPMETKGIGGAWFGGKSHYKTS